MKVLVDQAGHPHAVTEDASETDSVAASSTLLGLVGATSEAQARGVSVLCPLRTARWISQRTRVMCEK